MSFSASSVPDQHFLTRINEIEPPITSSIPFIMPFPQDQFGHPQLVSNCLIKLSTVSLGIIPIRIMYGEYLVLI
jgi:hypothetical protein